MEHFTAGKTQQPSKAVVYLRVSTEEQVGNYSLETQEDICRKEAERREIEILEVFREEGRSAKTITGRPVLIEMLEYCRKHKKEVDAVIVYRLDRISRQTADYLAIRKKLMESEIKLISVTEPTGNSPTEKFVETMLAGFAQMDNDVRSERTKNGMHARFLSGLPSNGCVSPGYLSQNGYAIKDSETFEIWEEAWEQMATGTKTLRQMAAILNEKGIKSNKGGKMYPQELSRIFRNKFYIGKIVSKKYGQEVPGQHPPMVTEEKFYRVQAVLDGRNVNISAPLARRNPDNPDFPLRRIIKCGKCGASMTGGWCKGKRKHYAHYFCSHRCSGSNVAAGLLEEATIKELYKVAPKKKTIELFISYLRTKYYSRASELVKRRAQADDELKKLYEFRQALIEKNLSGTYSDEMFKEQNKIVEDKVKDIQITKNDDLLRKYSLELIIKFIETKLANLIKTYQESSLEQKRTLLCSIYPSGLQYSEKRLLNTGISPVYTSILILNRQPVSFGALRRT